MSAPLPLTQPGTPALSSAFADTIASISLQPTLSTVMVAASTGATSSALLTARANALSFKVLLACFLVMFNSSQGTNTIV
ncbi:MAG TPA: hypothetical protein DCW52_01640 [Gammaproteobacteria bacterium]|nr:hypothetical protein [Gammaproteobacteria bacterium]